MSSSVLQQSGVTTVHNKPLYILWITRRQELGVAKPKVIKRDANANYLVLINTCSIQVLKYQTVPSKYVQLYYNDKWNSNFKRLLNSLKIYLIFNSE